MFLKRLVEFMAVAQNERDSLLDSPSVAQDIQFSLEGDQIRFQVEKFPGYPMEVFILERNKGQIAGMIHLTIRSPSGACRVDRLASQEDDPGSLDGSIGWTRASRDRRPGKPCEARFWRYATEGPQPPDWY